MNLDGPSMRHNAKTDRRKEPVQAMKMQVFALSVGLTWLLIPQVTMAQSKGTADEDSAKAAVRFQQAVEFVPRGQLRGRAGRISESLPNQSVLRVLYNIAQTQYALHDFVSAHRSLVQYMAEGRGEIPPIVVPGRRNVGKARGKDRRVADFDECDGRRHSSRRRQRGDIAPFRARPGQRGNAQVSAFKIAPPGSPYGDRGRKRSVKVELQIDESIVTSAARAPGAVSSSVPLIERTQPQAVSLIKTTQPRSLPGEPA